MLTILNFFVPNNMASNNIRQTLKELQIKMDKSTIIVKDFNTLLSVTHKEHKNQKE